MVRTSSHHLGGGCFLLQSVRGDLAEKEEWDTTGLESGDQESHFLSAPRGTKAVGKEILVSRDAMTLYCMLCKQIMVSIHSCD